MEFFLIKEKEPTPFVDVSPFFFTIHSSLFISVALSLWRWARTPRGSNTKGTVPSAFYFVKRWGPVPACSESQVFRAFMASNPYRGQLLRYHRCYHRY